MKSLIVLIFSALSLNFGQSLSSNDPSSGNYQSEMRSFYIELHKTYTTLKAVGTEYDVQKAFYEELLSKRNAALIKLQSKSYLSHKEEIRLKALEQATPEEIATKVQKMKAKRILGIFEQTLNEIYSELTVAQQKSTYRNNQNLPAPPVDDYSSKALSAGSSRSICDFPLIVAILFYPLIFWTFLIC